MFFTVKSSQYMYLHYMQYSYHHTSGIISKIQCFLNSFHCCSMSVVNVLWACRVSLLNTWQTWSIDKLEMRWLRESITIAVFISVLEGAWRPLYKTPSADIQPQTSEKLATGQNLHTHTKTRKSIQWGQTSTRQPCNFNHVAIWFIMPVSIRGPLEPSL